MQAKEKKWIEVESILKPYIDEDCDLAGKLREMKMIIVTGETTRLTSVVSENETLKTDLAKAYRNIDKLRSKIVDPVFRARDLNTNGHMLGKPRARRPPSVLVTTDEIIRLKNSIKGGTCLQKHSGRGGLLVPEDEVYPIRSSSSSSNDNATE